MYPVYDLMDNSFATPNNLVLSQEKQLKHAIERRNASGQAEFGVMLAPFGSVWPVFLAELLYDQGVRCVQVWRGSVDAFEANEKMPLFDATPFESRLEGIFRRRCVRHLGWFESMTARLNARQYEKRTGRSLKDQQNKLSSGAEWEFLDRYFRAKPLARAVMSLKPRFVFGHRVTLTGRAVSLCEGIPKILMPHGADIFYEPESSPLLFNMVKKAMQQTDLIIPGSEDATAHIINRYEVSPERVKTLTWGIDLEEYHRAGTAMRAEICADWGIDPNKTLISNIRRFHPEWGCWVALDAFIRVASQRDDVHFICVGGGHGKEYYPEAKRRVKEANLTDRFLFLPPEEIPLSEFVNMLTVTDIFVSLRRRGDMRSLSLLQAAAAGGVPIVADLPDHRIIQERGFSALLVDPENSTDVFEAIQSVLNHPEKRELMAKQNEQYLDTHENQKRQIGKMVKMIDQICNSYSS